LAVGDVHASTVVLNSMIEHHIIYTISGRDCGLGAAEGRWQYGPATRRAFPVAMC
jgi:hypothetical protein